MNSDKQTQSSQRGNVLIYVIIALALLGGLTMLLAKQGGESDDISYETNELVVTKTVAFAAAAKNVVDQMMMSGTSFKTLSYLRPTMAGFDTAPNYNKVFHPEGGGLTLAAPDPNLFVPKGIDTPDPGWYMGRFNNVEWTPSTERDIILTAYNINQAACQAINKKITGSASIPTITSQPKVVFVSVADRGVGPLPADLTKTNCPDCEGQPSLCVSYTSGTTIYSYYNIISAQ